MQQAITERPHPYQPNFLPENTNFSQTILPILSSILTELCKANDRCQPNERGSSKITKFHAAQVPPISIENYLKRIAQYSEASDTCYILALVYLDRIQARPEFLVTSLNIHRLLITSVMVAAKFFDDHYYNNAFYARIGGIAKEEMNSLELEFLFMIGFSLSVNAAEFQQYDSELRAHFQRRQAMMNPPTRPTPVTPTPVYTPTTCQPVVAGYIQPIAAPAYSAPHMYHAPRPVAAQRANFSYPSHNYSNDADGDVCCTQNNMDVEDNHCEQARKHNADPSLQPRRSQAVAIKHAHQQPQNTTSCSPPTSDFVESMVSANQWVMIK